MNLASPLVIFLITAFVADASVWQNHLVSQAAQNVDNAVHHFMKNHIKLFRYKRDIGCVLVCVQNMSRDLGSEYKDASGGMVNPRLFNITKFEELCNIYKKGKACLDRCDDSRMKTTLTAAFKSLDYLCIDHYQEFISHTVCYQAAHETVMEQCTPECGDQSQMAILKGRQEALKKMRSLRALQKVKDILSCMCNFLDCHVSCDIPIYDEMCDDTAPGDFIKDFSKTTFKGLEKLMVDNGVGSLWPNETCGKIGNGQFGFAENADCVEDFTDDDNDVYRFKI